MKDTLGEPVNLDGVLSGRFEWCICNPHIRLRVSLLIFGAVWSRPVHAIQASMATNQRKITDEA